MMRVIRLADAPDLTPAWDRFIAGHKHGWFWHTSAWLAYQRAYRAENIDESFAVLGVDGSVIAVAPLVVSKDETGAPEFSFSGSPTPRLLHHPRDGRFGPPGLHGVVEEQRLRVAKTRGVTRGVFAGWAFDGDANQDSPVTLRVIDLAYDEATLWRDVRKSYKALIHRGEERFTVSVADASECGRHFESYERLHRLVYAEPRPEATYRLQHGWLHDGYALVVLALPLGREAVGATYWIVYKGSAYYASGAYAEDNIAHAVVWRSILALKARGIRSAVMGWRGLERTDKERGVTHFKCGFGAADVPVAVSEVTY